MVTFALLFGAELALGLFPILSREGVPFTSFALFMGVMMATTGFPILTRILTDRKLEKTERGETALSCAATVDITAWCLLAILVVATQADLGDAVWMMIGGGVAFLAIVSLAIQPLLNRAIRCGERWPGVISSLVVVGTFLTVLAASLTTEMIGAHAIIAAFLLGTAVPHNNRFARKVPTKAKKLVTILLLPAFFVFTGMRTRINLVSGWEGWLSDWEGWLWCGAIILVAMIGKFCSTLAAAAQELETRWQDAPLFGTLMNARGVMELIVLNIGFDLGIINPTLFAMMVIMVLATAVATTVALQWLIPSGGAPCRLDQRPPKRVLG